MRVYSTIISVVVFLLFTASSSVAVDLVSLDRVSVLMPKSEVLALLGKADKVTDMGGLAVDLYLVNDAAPLLSVGFFYEHELALAGSSLVFSGDLTAHSFARMKSLGFRVLEEKGDYLRLEGKDDDTGRPVIVTISRLENLTTVTTFEKRFYERRATREVPVTN